MLPVATPTGGIAVTFGVGVASVRVAAIGDGELETVGAVVVGGVAAEAEVATCLLHLEIDLPAVNGVAIFTAHLAFGDWVARRHKGGRPNFRMAVITQVRAGFLERLLEIAMNGMAVRAADSGRGMTGKIPLLEMGILVAVLTQLASAKLVRVGRVYD